MKLLLILILTLTQAMNKAKSEENSKAYFGAGCFWCVEAIFEEIKGVKDVKSGYSGGNKKNPTYEDICKGNTKHAEICEITYDSSKISYNNLLEIFFLSHDPTSINRQGNDIGPQYRSIILYQNKKEKEDINKYIYHLNQKNIFEDKIATEIIEFKNFYKAENYHQNYYINNKTAPYCKVIITPKVESLRKKLKKYY